MRPGPATPEETESGSVPAKDGVRLDYRDGPTPGRQERGADDQLQPVDWAQRGSLDVPPEDVELVAKHGVLDDQLAPGTTRVSGEPRELASGAAKVESRPESADRALDPFRHRRNREQPHLAIRPRVAVEAADNLEFQLRLRADARGSQHGRHLAGWMFWFSRNAFIGSNLCFTTA